MNNELSGLNGNRGVEPSKPDNHRQRRTDAEVVAARIADKASIIKVLRQGIIATRAVRTGGMNSDVESVSLADLWSITNTERGDFRGRYTHCEFSRQLWAHMERFNGYPHQRVPIPK